MFERIHVVPADDLVDHEVSEDCVCGPDVEYLAAGDGDGWYVVHHSLDGRETVGDQTGR